MKFLLVVVVIVVVAWLLLGRRGAPPPSDKPPRDPERKSKGAQSMLACAHCGVHLPDAETVKDAAGRPFCTEAHRLAGPR